MDHTETTIDNQIEDPKERRSPLERIPAPQKKEEPVLKPMDPLHILRMQNREEGLPDAPKEDVEVPIVPNMKKAEEDYNSIDYQLVAFNLWKAKAREFF